MKITKIEQFALLMLESENAGISRWEIVGKLKSNNPGAFASTLRKKYKIQITKGDNYRVKDLNSAKALVYFINEKRSHRLLKPLEPELIEQWFEHFDGSSCHV